MFLIAGIILTWAPFPVWAQDGPRSQVDRLIERLKSDAIEERAAAFSTISQDEALAEAVLTCVRESQDPDLRALANELQKHLTAKKEDRLQIDQENQARAKWLTAIKGKDGSTQAALFQSVAQWRGRPLEPYEQLVKSWSDSAGTFSVYALDQDFSLLVEWNTATRATATKLAIVGFSDLRKSIKPSLYRYLRLVNRSPTLDGELFDPDALLQAVNALIRLGESGTFQVLKEYEALGLDMHTKKVYEYDGTRMMVLSLLLFDYDPGVPRGLLVGRLNGLAAHPDHNWLYCPILVVNDIPFLVCSGVGFLSGVPETAWDRLKRCQEHAHLRSSLLTPRSSPAEALDKLWLSDEWKHAVDDLYRDHLRSLLEGQAKRAVH